MSAELSQMAEEALRSNAGGGTTVERSRGSTIDAASVPAGDVIAATGIFGSKAKSMRAQRRPVLASVRWPSEEQFDDFYHPPEEYQAPPMSPKVKEDQPLPSARKSISCLEESTSPGIQSFIYWQFLNRKEQEASIKQRPWSGKAVGMFEASALYREACGQLGVPVQEMIVPRPIFGDSVEVSSLVVVGTKQCYAVAEALRACMPRKIAFTNTVMTDMGAARIAEAAVNGCRLESLRVTGTCLGYRFCTALYDCLRTKNGNTLSEITLRGCGFGLNLDVEPRELPALVANTYNKCLSALPEGIIDPAREDADLRAASPSEPGDDFGEEVPNAEETKMDDADAQRMKRKQKAEQKQDEDSNRDEEQEADGALECVAPVEAPWWEEETAPSRNIPVALPLIIHIGRPGSAIKRLDLSATEFTLEMARCIGWALSNSQMEALILDRCCIDDAALSAVTNGLAQNNMLMDLSLRGNNLSGAADPVSELIHIAGRHASLAHFDFADNPINPKCVTELLSLMRYSCSVLCMHILGTAIPGEDAQKVAWECRAWVEENMSSLDAAVARVCGDREDSDEEDTFFEVAEEMILCRARHVDALTAWRVTSHTLHAKKKAANKGEVVTAPRSWMPSGCWICRKCATVDFRWVVPDRGEGDETGSTGARLFVRPSFAEYSRVELQRDRAEGSKRVAFMGQVIVPPGTHSYIFESLSQANAKMLLCARDQSSAELAAITTKDESPPLLDMCKEYGYGGRINVLPPVKESDFKIPEHFETEGKSEQEADAWSEDPIRQKVLYECYHVDLPCLHFDEICHVDEEDEVKGTVWEIYGYLYDTYAMYAGRSLWPLIRQVDVYSFFEEGGLLDRGPMSFDGFTDQLDTTEQTARECEAKQGEPSPTHSAGNVSQGGSSPSRSVTDSPSKQHCKRSARCCAAGTPAEALASAVKGDVGQPLSTQDIQQMIVQTITRRKNTIRHDATWSQHRKQLVVQRTLEGAPITRPQFVEVLLRAAVALRGREPSTSVALRQFSERILAGRIMRPPLSPFPRGALLKAGVVRDALLARRKSLRQAYERFGSNETSFQRLAQLLKLCDRCFTAKHVASIYALSRRPIKCANPQSSTLDYDEFSEAVARLSLVWQPNVGLAMVSNPGTARACPPQPRVGEPVNQKRVAARLEAFLERLTERMKPTVVSRF